MCQLKTSHQFLQLSHPPSPWFFSSSTSVLKWKFKIRFRFWEKTKGQLLLLLVTRICSENPLGLSCAGSGSSSAVAGLGFFLGAHPFFQPVHHLGPQWDSARVSSSAPGRAGICVNREFGASLCVLRVRNPRGHCPRGEDELSKLLHLSFLFFFSSDVEL